MWGTLSVRSNYNCPYVNFISTPESFPALVTKKTVPMREYRRASEQAQSKETSTPHLLGLRRRK
jgi:hypothetical protein